MFKKIAIIISLWISGGFIPLAYGDAIISHNSHDDKSMTIQADTKNLLNKTVVVGNKLCPISGDKIDKKTEVTYEYNGKIYSFCCSDCINEFKKNPEKYIKIIGKEKK